MGGKKKKKTLQEPGDVPKVKLKTASDIINRLRWDPDCGFNPDEVKIGFKDMKYKEGIGECSVSKWKFVREGGEVPEHAIEYFHCRGLLLWDKKLKYDLLCNSGQTESILVEQGRIPWTKPPPKRKRKYIKNKPKPKMNLRSIPAPAPNESNTYSKIAVDSAPCENLKHLRQFVLDQLSTTPALKNMPLYEFGSTVVGLEVQDSDLDLAIVTDKDPVDVLSELVEFIEENETPFQICRVILTSNIPMIRLFVQQKGHSTLVDLVCRCSHEITDTVETVEFMKCILSKDPRILAFVMHVKHWACRHRVIGGETRFPNGYGWFSWCIFALRHWYGVDMDMPGNVTVEYLVAHFFINFLSQMFQEKQKVGMDLDSGEFIKSDTRLSLVSKYINGDILRSLTDTTIGLLKLEVNDTIARYRKDFPTLSNFDDDELPFDKLPARYWVSTQPLRKLLDEKFDTRIANTISEYLFDGFRVCQFNVLAQKLANGGGMTQGRLIPGHALTLSLPSDFLPEYSPRLVLYRKFFYDQKGYVSRKLAECLTGLQSINVTISQSNGVIRLEGFDEIIERVQNFFNLKEIGAVLDIDEDLAPPPDFSCNFTLNECGIESTETKCLVRFPDGCVHVCHRRTYKFRAPKPDLVAEIRIPLILAEMALINADIYSLQEVDHETLSRYLRPFFRSRGYRICFLPKHGMKVTDGSAIAYRADKFVKEASLAIDLFKENGIQMHHNALMVCLRHLQSGRQIRVCATHLKAGLSQEMEQVRLEQVQQLLKCILDTDNTHMDSIIFLGDFNSPLGWFGVENAVVAEVCLHLNLAPSPDFTHLGGWSEGNVKTKLDYIFYGNNWQVQRILDCPHVADLPPEGFPCRIYGSDHIALAADLEWAS